MGIEVQQAIQFLSSPALLITIGGIISVSIVLSMRLRGNYGVKKYRNLPPGEVRGFPFIGDDTALFMRPHSPATLGQFVDQRISRCSQVKELRAAIGPLSGSSLKYCSDECLRRYLRARNWSIPKSKKMLQESLKWRSVYKPEEIRWEEVAGESETGKCYKAGFHDREGRTVVIMTPAKQNTRSQEDQLKHLVHLLENVVLNLADNQEQMVWLIDFTGWSLSNAVPIKAAREANSILQNHYPERLAAAFMYNPPRIFEAFWKVVKMFLDPITFQKIKFVYPKNEESMEVMNQHFDMEILPSQFGGKNEAGKYSHEDYSRMMLKDDIKTAAVWGLDEKTTAST